MYGRPAHGPEGDRRDRGYMGAGELDAVRRNQAQTRQVLAEEDEENTARAALVLAKGHIELALDADQTSGEMIGAYIGRPQSAEGDGLMTL